MAATPRLNTVIRALETGKIPVTVFAPPTGGYSQHPAMPRPAAGFGRRVVGQ